MTLYRRANEVLRVHEGLYGDLEAAVIRVTGCEPDQAHLVIDAVLGPLGLAPSPLWVEAIHPCGHAYWSPDGEWLFCLERGPHVRHMDRYTEHWNSSDPHDVDLRRFG